MKKHIYSIVFILAGFALQSCSEESIEKTAPPVSRLFAVHVSPSLSSTDALELYTADVSFGNNNRRANLAYGAAAATNPSAGNVFLKARLGTTSETSFISGNYTAENYTYYTALVTNVDATNTTPTAPVGIAVLHDNLIDPGQANAQVRIIHLGVEAPAVDLYFYVGNDQPAPFASGLTYGKSFPGNVSIPLQADAVSGPVVADFVTVPAGSYNFRVRPAGAEPDAPTVLTGTTALAAGRTYTLIVRGYLTPPAGITGRNLALQSLLHERTTY